MAAPGASVGPTRPVVVSAPAAAARVRVLMVTWNRAKLATAMLRCVEAQTYPKALLDITVIDNASTDGTLEHLTREFKPELVITNATEKAHEPAFSIQRESGEPNSAGFGSFTIIRNQTNMGGCGGFNTGLAFAEWAAGGRTKSPAPDYLWLIDDDAEVAPDALMHLTRTMASSPDVGLVGTRTVNIVDRQTTIETTIYYNSWTGAMQDDCPPENPKRAAFEKWIPKVGSTRGLDKDGKPIQYSGQMDVDVVSACSMLARWGAVTGTADPNRPAVGFWDWRYFIYCDDADWCLRFARAGWRVVLSLDAVVYHTPWNLKLTPARIYYANRNKVWMGQKMLAGRQLRTVTARAIKSILRDSIRAGTHRRRFHADIILNTARDIAMQVTGKTGSDGPPAEDVFEAFRRVGALAKGSTVAVMCCSPDAVKWLENLRTLLSERINALPIAERSALTLPAFRIIAANTVPNVPEGSIIYGRHRSSRLKKQLHTLGLRPTAVVVFEQTNDFPLFMPTGGVSAPNIHIDQKSPTKAQVEQDGWIPLARFLLRWAVIGTRCLWWAYTVKPYHSKSRYG